MDAFNLLALLTVAFLFPIATLIVLIGERLLARLRPASRWALAKPAALHRATGTMRDLNQGSDL